MSSSTFFYAIGDFFQWSFGFFEFIRDYANYFFIIVGSFGMLYWLNIQRKLNAVAAKDPSKLK